MAHYAFINEQGIVTSVIVGKDEDDGTDWEAYYGSRSGLVCRRTSYNTRAGVHVKGGTPYRKNFAAKGYSYDPQRDAFIPRKPFPSWVLDEQTCTWQPPVPRPAGLMHKWDEDAQSWVSR